MQISGQRIDKICGNSAGIIDLKGIQLCHLSRIERAFFQLSFVAFLFLPLASIAMYKRNLQQSNLVGHQTD